MDPKLNEDILFYLMYSYISSNIYPSLQDNLLKHAEINILESEKRANGPLHVRDHYMVYLIDVK